MRELGDATGKERSTYAAAHRKKVVVTGIVVPYDELPLGSNTADRLMHKRYFKNEVVFNFCLRELIFVVNEIQLK